MGSGTHWLLFMCFASHMRYSILLAFCIIQAIVERARHTLKLQLEKQKGGDTLPLATILNKALYTLNFLNCTDQGITPAEKHWAESNKATLPQVFWKDVLQGIWVGPSLVLMWV
jgi:hypothetical protein